MEEYSKEYIIEQLIELCTEKHSNYLDTNMIEATIDMINHDTFWHEVNCKKYKKEIEELKKEKGGVKLSKEDLNILIKMENLIGYNEKKLFGNKTEIKLDDTTITRGDFVDFMNIIEELCKEVLK